MADDAATTATDGGRRDDLHAASPILGWTTLYLIVAAALLGEIIAFTAITLSYR